MSKNIEDNRITMHYTRIYHYLNSISNNFQESFRSAMTFSNITIEQLSADSDVSIATIDRIRNADDYIPSKNTLFKLCIGMHLEYEISIDLFRKAGYSFSYSKEDLLYSYILRKCKDDDIETCLLYLNDKN